MTQTIQAKIQAVRSTCDSESKRLIELVGEAERSIGTPGQQEGAFFAYSVCLESRQDLDKVLSAVREVESVLLQQSKQKGGASGGNETIRLSVETALVERKIKSITSNLNAARQTLDGVFDIWGTRQPTGGLWDK